MRAVIVTETSGPSGVEVRELPEPPRPKAGEGRVLVDVRALGISFPDLLLSKGEYQVRPETPFPLGVDVAGVVRESVSTASGDFAAGQRVAVLMGWGAGCEVLAAPADAVLPLPDGVSFEHGAAIGMNYLTAHFALAHRGGLVEGETVLVTGAAGGLGTALLQVARGLGARTIGVVSTEEKAELARSAGAHDTVVVGRDADGTGGLRDAVRDLTDGVGVQVVADVVGGDGFTDYLRTLAPEGRLLVLGFTGRSIPEVKVNRLLLNNLDVRGVGWGAYAMTRAGFVRRQWEELLPLIEGGAVDPPLAPLRPVEQITDALVEMEGRRTLGKSVLTF